VIKVAVCISGQPRGDYKKCREQLQLNFPDADFYYSAWEGCETDVDTWFIEEPVLDYHPYGDIPKDIVLSERLADKIPKFMSKQKIILGLDISSSITGFALVDGDTISF